MVHLILHNKFSFTELWAQVLDWSQCPGNPGCINTQQARQWQHYKLAHLYNTLTTTVNRQEHAVL